MTIKVGHGCEFDVPVKGEPPPTTVWTFNETVTIESDTKIKVCRINEILLISRVYGFHKLLTPELIFR